MESVMSPFKEYCSMRGMSHVSLQGSQLHASSLVLPSHVPHYELHGACVLVLLCATRKIADYDASSNRQAVPERAQQEQAPQEGGVPARWQGRCGQ